MPAVSIILPTYNRAKFLPDALAAIAAQRWTDWELIVVDDGSSDNTRELIPELTRGWLQPVRYIYQENQGAYGARNTGLDQVQGKYVAFYDSDDLWLPHHLSDCVGALGTNPGVDWVYGSCRMVNLTTSTEIAPTTFYIAGKPRPFLSLKGRAAGNLHIIEDADAACCQILHGLYCGLQNSVIRSRVFENYRFDVPLRNEAEDQVVVIWALASGFTFAYLDQVHVVYNVHESNSSAASQSLPVEKLKRLHEAMIAGFERLKTIAPLSAKEHKALRKRLGDEHFWHLGYVTHWMHGNKKAAFASFRRGIACWPWDWRFYKTMAAAVARSAVPERAKRAWWWVSDSQWRRENGRNQQRVSRFRAIQRRAMKSLLSRYGEQILAGPFSGLRYTPARGKTYCAHVLLGTYETEIRDVIEKICDERYETIVDIGASDGYYLCGLAHRQAAKRIIGFEAEQELHPVIHAMASANALESRIELKGMCDALALCDVLARSGNSLVLCDIDGGELDLLNPTSIPLLAGVDILVETHDILRPGITASLIQRFEQSHNVVEIVSKDRTLEDFPHQFKLATEDKLGAMDEFRGGRQSWLWMRALEPANQKSPKQNPDMAHCR